MAFANIPEINSTEFAIISNNLYDSEELTKAILDYQTILKDIRAKIPKQFQITHKVKDDEKEKGLESM